MSRSAGSRRLYEKFGSSGHLTKRTSTRTTGEVFYYDKYGRLSYRCQKVDIPSPSKHACTDLSLQRVKVTSKSEPTGHDTDEINSTTEKQESRSSAEVKYKETFVVYENHNLCKKESEEINYPGDTSISSELLYIKPNPEINLPICLVLDAIWCGSLEILDKQSAAGSQFYDGFVAHLPGKLCRKAVEHAQLMPSVLPCTMLSSCNVWEEIFQNESPTIEDIALFIFPGNFERSKEQYFRLVQVMETQDLVLRSLIKGVSLLIFSSKRLHLDPCGLRMKSFLWGVYCPLQVISNSQALSTKVKPPLSDAWDAALLIP